MARLRHPVQDFSNLVTNESRLQAIQQLSKHISHSGDLFRPPVDWFDGPQPDTQLERIAKALCLWLGVKPRHLMVAYTEDLGDAPGRYYEDSVGHHIEINRIYRRKPYESVAILAHELMHYVVEGRWHVELPDQMDMELFVDLASIQLGFGTLILNGCNHYETWLQRLAQQLILNETGLSLGSLSPKEYSRQLGHEVAVSTKLNANDLYQQLAPWSRRLFDTPLTHHGHVAVHVSRLERRIRSANLVSAGSLATALVVASLTFYIVHLMPTRINASLAAKKDNVDALYNAYVLCTETVVTRQTSMPKPDIFQQQSLNADSNRCLSIANQYNATVESYNQELRKIK